MATLVEVDEAELLRLRNLQTVFGKALQNPAARKYVAKAVKEVSPNDPIAKEADTLDPIETKFKAIEDDNAALRKEIADGNAKREQDSKLAALTADREKGLQSLRDQKWTEDGIKKVLEVMEQKGILDVAIAAKWVESQMPPPNPINQSVGVGAWGFTETPADGQDDIKKLIETRGANEGIVSKMAGEAIAEVRGTSRR